MFNVSPSSKGLSSGSICWQQVLQPPCWSSPAFRDPSGPSLACAIDGQRQEPMTFYIVRRLTLLLPTIFLASVIIFVLMRSIPGDPASLQIGDESSRAQVDALKKQLGIDKPIYQQYFVWAGNVVRGDLGKSLRSRQPGALCDRRLELSPGPDRGRRPAGP